MIAPLAQGGQNLVSLLGTSRFHLDIDADIADRDSRVGAVMKDVDNVRLMFFQDIE